MSRNEKRIAEIVTLDSSSFTNISEPTNSDLIDFHKKNAATYTSPEFRELTFINLTVDDIAKKISVSEQAIVDQSLTGKCVYTYTYIHRRVGGVNHQRNPHGV